MAADRKLLAAAFAAIAFLTAGPARGAVTRPTQTAPAAGAVVQFLPSFAWTPVSGAARYEFQISADAGMNSPCGHGSVSPGTMQLGFESPSWKCSCVFRTVIET